MFQAKGPSFNGATWHTKTFPLLPEECLCVEKLILDVEHLKAKLDLP